jgi:purine nucleosidase
MAVAIDPEICTHRSRHYVDVETEGVLTRGMTVVDQLDVADDERNAPLWEELIERGPNVEVCWEIDVPRWKELLYSVLR